ncbi:MAG: 50S ribosomal protein L29 [Chloroflexi bacterium]|nr:50S ribosomal protein L29 [Chloroflexota bacterium]
MANIVELREMNESKLAEMLDDAREDLFNLRFRRTSGQLEDYSRLKAARRNIAQLETVIHMRRLAVEAAVAHPEIAAALNGEEWEAEAHFDYEDSAWLVEFNDADGDEVATASVNVNKKQPKSKREAAKKGQPQLVTSYNIAG